jgi:CBS domain-containing protein
MNGIAHVEEKLPTAFAEASVADAMSTGIISCSPETPLRVVARIMATYGVHAVFVFEHRDEDDEDRRFWGIVSDLDLVAAAPVIDERTAGTSAVTPIVMVRAEDPLARAAELMARHGIAHLAVVDPDVGRPVGVVSTIDLARALAADHGDDEILPSG